jgi:hypothetical protein
MPIQFEINVFKDLIAKYSNWEDLRKYVESEEGGQFRVVDKDDNGLCLIRYEKGTSNMTLPHSKWFRSVVWNTKTNRPVSVAPPKASSEELPFKTLKSLSEANVVCQELIDGFMINCFRVVGDEKLHITSRSKMDAAGKFYSEKTFRELFTEAFMNTSGGPFYSETIIQDNSRDIIAPDSSKNETSVFYSFVVQHKEHRIVTRVEKNTVYVVQKGTVFEDGRVVIEESPESGIHFVPIPSIQFEKKQAKISYAQVAAEGQEDEVQKWIKSVVQEKDWQFQGLVLKDGAGNRWRFRSEKYAAVKALRGNSPTVRERFCQLYSQNLIRKYWEYYSEDIPEMNILSILMDVISTILYKSYVDLHITKIKKAEEIDKMYLPHLYTLHGIYLSQLRAENKKITLNEIQVYLHKQPWQRISFLIKKSLEQMNATPVA